jgi:hypothetical protein
VKKFIRTSPFKERAGRGKGVGGASRESCRDKERGNRRKGTEGTRTEIFGATDFKFGKQRWGKVGESKLEESGVEQSMKGTNGGFGWGNTHGEKRRILIMLGILIDRS